LDVGLRLDISNYGKATIAAGTTIEARNLKYFDLKIDGLKVTDALSLGQAEAAASEELALKLTNTSTDDLRSPWAAVEAIFKTISADELRDSWLIEKAIQSDQLIYVLVSGAVYADDASFRIGNQEGKTSGTLKLSVKGATVSVDVTVNTSANWKGRSTPFLIRLYAFRPYLDRTTNHYRFQTVDTDSNRTNGRAISASFRGG
jgi:hypothetical protein